MLLFLTTLVLSVAILGSSGLPFIHPRADPGFAVGIPIPRFIIDLVKARAIETSKASWELSTLAEGLLEIDWPHLSVYGDQGVPLPRSVTDKGGVNNISSVLAVADYVLAIRPVGILPLMQDGSSGDPASTGVAMLIANWTRGSRPDAWKNDYDTPLKQQMHYLIDLTPRTTDGAISHRSEFVQLWSDSVFMVPPFLAFYAALNEPNVNSWLMYQAYEQIRLYRNYLCDPPTGLWKHIVLGWSGNDEGSWSTGNAWAASGILRVLVTMNQTTAGYHPVFQAAQRDLQNWATDVVNNMWKYQQENGTLLNYADNPASFADSSSTALLAAATFRIATLSSYLRGPPDGAAVDPAIDALYGNMNVTFADPIPLLPSSLYAAHNARVLVIDSLDTTTGWLANVANPWNFGVRGTRSPEGQSFVLMMESAWAGWKSWVTSRDSAGD